MTPKQVNQAVDKPKNIALVDDIDLEKASALKVAQERIKTLEADIAKKETEQTVQTFSFFRTC